MFCHYKYHSISQSLENLNNQICFSTFVCLVHRYRAQVFEPIVHATVLGSTHANLFISIAAADQCQS